MPKSNTTRVLEALKDCDEPISCEDLSHLLDLPSSSIYNSVYALLKQRFNIQKTEGGSNGKRSRKYHLLKQHATPTTITTTAELIDVHAHTHLADRCYYFLAARHVSTTASQVADFFEISNEQAANLMQHVASLHKDLQFNISARIVKEGIND